MKGYKVFHPDWTCRGFQYEVGKEYKMEEEPVRCERGFHFCTKLIDCFEYYSFNPNNKVAEIEAFGKIAGGGDDSKHCTNGIRIVRELSWREVLDLVNTGTNCTGIGNSGDCNSGNRNSGSWNSGDCNSGSRNSGDWNHTCFSAGIFNTEEQKIRMFNKESDWTYRTWLNSYARAVLAGVPGMCTEWVYSENMTDKEKAEHPEHETMGGYSKFKDNRSAITKWWNDLGEGDRLAVESLPNFDWGIFCQCTGIDKEKGHV